MRNYPQFLSSNTSKYLNSLDTQSDNNNNNNFISVPIL